MRPDGPASVGLNQRFPLYTRDTTNSGMLKQVIVHATLDSDGNAVDTVFRRRRIPV